MAKGWKRAVERGLARSGLAGLAEGRRRPTTVILAYHNIVPSGEPVAGDASLHVDQEVFADQLDWLLEGRRVVALDEAMEPSGREEATRIVVTFDDAYRGTMTAGMEEVGKRKLPSTVFVPPGLLGSDGFWWDRLAPPGRPLDPAVRTHALTGLRGRQEDILRWADSEGLALAELPGHARPVDAAALETRDLPAGTTLGAHTWDHPNLVELSGADVESQLRRSRAWLSGRPVEHVDWLAYPYGLADDAVEAAARSSFEGALLVSGGAAEVKGRWAGTRHSVPRVNVARGLSLEGLALRLGGLGA